MQTSTVSVQHEDYSFIRVLFRFGTALFLYRFILEHFLRNCLTVSHDLHRMNKYFHKVQHSNECINAGKTVCVRRKEFIMG